MRAYWRRDVEREMRGYWGYAMGYGGDGKNPVVIRLGSCMDIVAWILLHGYCCMDIVATMLLGVTTRYNEGKALIRRRLRGGWGVGVARMDG